MLMFLSYRCMAFFSFMFGFLCWLPIFILGFPFFLVALISKNVKAAWRFISAKPVPWQSLIEYMPEVGWKPKANLNSYVRVDGVYRLTTDAQGWRGTTRIDDSDVVVFGDSYAFGYGVSDKDYFASLRNGFKIKAIGVNGYNMVQELLWMRKLSDKLNGKIVIWFIYHGNDLLENLTPNLAHHRMPFVRFIASENKWQIVTEHVSSEPWTTSKRRQYHKSLASYCQSSSAPSRIFDACGYLIKEGKSVCDKAGAKLIVMSIPDVTQISPAHFHALTYHIKNKDDFDPDYPDKQLRAICQELSVPFITLKDYLSTEDHKVNDAHWNAKGHYKVAKAIQRVYSRFY